MLVSTFRTYSLLLPTVEIGLVVGGSCQALCLKAWVWLAFA